MTRLPSLKQLQHLVSLHEHQHFGRAAEACFVTQSTLSASIAHLEDILQGVLLERDHKSFIFTPLGEEVVRRAKYILLQTEEMTDFARRDGQPMQGSVRLACIPTIAPFILRQLLRIAREQYPRLNLLIREDTTDNALKQLMEGKLDLVILALPYPTPGLSVRVLCKDRFCFVQPVSWMNKGYDKDTTKWPDKSLFLLEKEHCLTGHALHACQLKDSQKINPFFATSLHTLVQMVDSEPGMTFLPELAVNNGLLEGSQLKAIPMTSEGAWRNIGIAWRPSSARQETWQNLGDIVTKICTSSAQLLSM